MKTKFILSVAFTLLLSVLSVSANESDTYSIYVTTQNSEKADEFAAKNVYELVETLNENTFEELQTIKLGNGILIENTEFENTLDTFFYPVFIDDTFKYILRVVDGGNNEYNGFLSIGAVEEIKSLSGESDYNNPITIYQSNGNLAYFNKHKDGILLRDPISDKNEPKQETLIALKNQRNAKIISNVNEISELVIEKPIENRMIEPRATGWLVIDYKETQGNNSWCSAYVNASAARFMTKNTSIVAKTIATYAGVGINDAIPWDSLVKWWGTKGYNFNYYSGQVGPGTVYADVSNRKPLFSAYKWYSGGWKYHALLIHGVDGNNLKVWNPWYSFSESASGTTFKYTSNSGITMDMYMFGRYSKK